MTINNNYGWKFDNSYIKLPDRLFTKQNPIQVPSPNLVIFNRDLAKAMGLDPDKLETEEGAAIFAGNLILDGSQPIAQAYAGHQFGHFTMLGDGRAVLLGEHISPKGERLDIQLKGSGRTPYSRGGDGRAALGPMLREYIISEALYNLGIPTTRSLAVVTTGRKIMREMPLTGAILTRIASSHIRVGTFEYISAYGNNEELRQLADYTIARHYPQLKKAENRYLLLIREVVKRQAELISKWQLVGFIHGVMNTDNMAISGESIDFGPCAFMDTYNPSTVFSSIDLKGRYSYENQVNIAAWNLARFADSLLAIIDNNQDRAIELATEEVRGFYNIFNNYWLDGMQAKLGLFNKEADDEGLIMDLLDIMYKYKADFTNTFRSLTIGHIDNMEIFKTEEFIKWKNRWESRKNRQKESEEDSIVLMKNNNPSVIPRNHRVEEALKVASENNDYTVIGNLNRILSNPYGYSKEQEEYCKLAPSPASPYRTFCGT